MIKKIFQFFYDPIDYCRNYFEIKQIGILTVLTLSLSLLNTYKSPAVWTEKTASQGKDWFIAVSIFIISVFIISYIIAFIYFYVLKIAGFSLNYYIATKGYGNAIITLKDAFHGINVLKSKIKPDNEKELTDTEIYDLKIRLTDFCTNIKNIYENKFGKGKCSVSIKLFPKPVFSQDNFQNMEIITVLRDSDWNRRDLNYDAHPHLISKNTCFKKIIENFIDQKWEDSVYINNNIPKDENYISSSLDVKKLSIEKFDQKKWKEDWKYRNQNWVLDYKSEIVLPIIPSNNQNDYFLLGFLCLDYSKGKHKVFNKAFDFPLLQGAVDGIYDIIWRNFNYLYNKH